MTVSPPERLAAAGPFQRALALAVLSIPAALLSNYAQNLFWLLPYPFNYPVSLHPALDGLYFGIVICIGLYCWVTRSPIKLLMMLALTAVAWGVAGIATIYVFEFIQTQLTGGGSDWMQYPVNYVVGLAGAAGGFVGSAILVASISFVDKEFRASDNWLRTIAIGTMSGALLECWVGGLITPSKPLPIHLSSLLPLFLIWQPAVAASIGYGLGWRKSRSTQSSPTV